LRITFFANIVVCAPVGGCPQHDRAKYFNISVACLDGLDIDKLMTAPVTYFDGLNNDWGSTPREIRHL
jgi:hypothetical protein